MGALIYLLLLSVLLTNLTLIQCSINQQQFIFKVEGDVNLALIINTCNNLNNSQPINPLSTQSYVNSAIWTVQRLNFLEYTSLKMGLTVYESCTEKDNYRVIFQLFQEDYFGVIVNRKLSTKIKQFSDVLNLKTKTINKFEKYLIRATTKLLNALAWNEEEITVIGPNLLMKSFIAESRKAGICLKDYFVYDRSNPSSGVIGQNFTGHLVVFGDEFFINSFLVKELNVYEVDVIFVPLDGSLIKGLPENSYVFIPPHVPFSPTYRKTVNILPSLLYLEAASPIICYAQSIRSLTNCSNNSSCLKISDEPECQMEPENVLEILRIEPLRKSFVYNVFKVENSSSNNSEVFKRNNFLQPYNKIFAYNIFDDSLTVVGNSTSNVSSENFCKLNPNECQNVCKNFKPSNNHNFNFPDDNNSQFLFFLRRESWVYAFLSLSLLGVLFCIAILIFLLICICRRDILEGNPILTLLLLVVVMLMYCAVLPVSVDSNRKDAICVIRSLAITLTYASAFSLILSRCILLSTAAKEVGFMSHVAGPVQSFLCLFIFGVQAALSLQVFNRCHDLFNGFTFIYLLSYNLMLLLLLLCLCPLIYKCQRNYEEGKYFTIATITISCTWSVWMSVYAIMDEEWKEPILCFGLVSTATILLGTIFVPRTYLMTIAAARDKITSALPSLATATSAIDIYRAGSQPVYDCVNIAAINATAISNGIMSIQQPDLYSCPNLPDGDELDERCVTPVSSDKVTRF